MEHAKEGVSNSNSVFLVKRTVLFIIPEFLAE